MLKQQVVSTYLVTTDVTAQRASQKRIEPVLTLMNVKTQARCALKKFNVTILDVNFTKMRFLVLYSILYTTLK